MGDDVIDDFIVYIAGKYTAETVFEKMLNIRESESALFRLTSNGIFAYSPHRHNAFLQGLADYEFWMMHCFAILRGCHALLLLPGWRDSKGACREKKLAEKLGIPILYSVDSVIDYVIRHGIRRYNVKSEVL